MLILCGNMVKVDLLLYAWHALLLIVLSITTHIKKIYRSIVILRKNTKNIGLSSDKDRPIFINYSKLTVPMNIATEPSSKYNGIPGTTKSSRSGNMRVRSRGTIRIVPSFLTGIMPSHETTRH